LFTSNPKFQAPTLKQVQGKQYPNSKYEISNR